MTHLNSSFFLLIPKKNKNKPVWTHDVITYYVDISLLSIIKSIKVYEYFRVLEICAWRNYL